MTHSQSQLIQACLTELNGVILGKDRQIRLALSCLFANGHMLIEDLPGMGKTTLSYALSRVLDLSYKRVQFTSDLLPADLIGATIFDPSKGQFSFHPGPVFSQLLLADELNRATPKAQSALLEAMEERQVSVEGHSHPLPLPFFVIATQNPQTQAGTFPLPESQLDRFLVRISLGYPDPRAERLLWMGRHGRNALDAVKAVLNQDNLKSVQAQVPRVQITDALFDYIERLVARSREDDLCHMGLSPRGALALIAMAKAWALLHDRQHVLPEDVQAVFVPVIGHRLVGRRETQGESLARHLLKQVDVVG